MVNHRHSGHSFGKVFLSLLPWGVFVLFILTLFWYTFTALRIRSVMDNMYHPPTFETIVSRCKENPCVLDYDDQTTLFGEDFADLGFKIHLELLTPTDYARTPEETTFANMHLKHRIPTLSDRVFIGDVPDHLKPKTVERSGGGSSLRMIPMVMPLR